MPLGLDCFCMFCFVFTYFNVYGIAKKNIIDVILYQYFCFGRSYQRKMWLLLLLLTSFFPRIGQNSKMKSQWVGMVFLFMYHLLTFLDSSKKKKRLGKLTEDLIEKSSTFLVFWLSEVFIAHMTHLACVNWSCIFFFCIYFFLTAH